jgi:hypothetical protein
MKQRLTEIVQESLEHVIGLKKISTSCQIFFSEKNETDALLFSDKLIPSKFPFGVYQCLYFWKENSSTKTVLFTV